MHVKYLTAVLLLSLAIVPVCAPAACKLEQYAELPVTMDGSAPFIPGAINGIPARFLVDSGAFFSELWSDRLGRVKLKAKQIPGGLRVTGIGGSEYAHEVTVGSFSLTGFGNGPLSDVRFVVTGPGHYPAVDGLIGQNILARAGAEYDLANGVVRLFHTTDCENYSMAYWAGSAPVSVMELEPINNLQFHIVGAAKLNGTKIRVLFDTGAATSALFRTAASRVGFDPSKADDYAEGIGSAGREGWLARFDDLDLGGEQIRNARLWVIDAAIGSTADLLLGADFFLSHRVFVATGQRRIYFTYNGGPVFNLRRPDFGKPGTSPEDDGRGTAAVTSDTPLAPKGVEAGPAAAIPDAHSAPRDASGYKRRGAASAARGDFASAIADLDAAIRLDAADPESFYQRGMAKWQYHHTPDAVTDLDQAMKLNPDDDRYLMKRALVRLNTNDPTGAHADLSTLLTRHPKGTELWVIGIYMAAKHYEEAIHQLDQWIDNNPKSDDLADQLNSRCWARALLGKGLELALDDCNRSLALDPNNWATLDSRGLVRLRLADNAGSMEDYKSALRRTASSAWSHYGLGLAEIRSGLKDNAETEFQKAQGIDPRIGDRFREIGLVP
jgi:tetratricopeptide (TPR) repeat protein